MEKLMDNKLEIIGSAEQLMLFDEEFSSGERPIFFPTEVEKDGKVYGKDSKLFEPLAIEHYRKSQQEEKQRDYNIYTYNVFAPIPLEVLEKGYIGTGDSWVKANWGTLFDIISMKVGDTKKDKTGNFSKIYKWQSYKEGPSLIIKIMQEKYPSLTFNFTLND